MKNIILITTILFLFDSCGFNSRDSLDLLNKDIENANKLANSNKVLIYKTIKVATKVIGTSDTSNAEFVNFIDELKNLYSLKQKSAEHYTIKDLYRIYKGYKKLSKNILEVDEDNYSTLTEAILRDSLKSIPKFDRKMLHSYEHGILSIIGFCSQGIAEDITLYESLKTKSELILDLQTKSLVQFIQGLNYMSKEFNYLAEREFTKNIELMENEKFSMPIIKKVTGIDSINETNIQKSFLALNYLMRFMARDHMSRKMDKENALVDLKKFIENAKSLGIENELTLNAELLLYLKLKDYSNALKTVEKLRLNKKLSTSQLKDYDKIANLLKANKKANRIEENINLFQIIIKEIKINAQDIDLKELLKDAKMEKSILIIEEFSKINSFKKYLDENENMDKIENKTKDIFNSIKDEL